MNPGEASAQAVVGQVYQRGIAAGSTAWPTVRHQIWQPRNGERGLDVLILIGALAYFAALQRSSLQP